MSLEDISRLAAHLDIEDDASSATSDDSVETVIPAGPRRTTSANNLQASANDEVVAPVRRAEEEEAVQPRADRGADTTRANAQGVCPPDACLFAANLLVGQAERQHEASLHALFDVFGRNWIQVKEDRNRYPFAIIQFETLETANIALRDGQGMMCAGRQVRLEKAKVDRALLITRMEGDRVVSEHEARDLLTRFGQIETICSTDLIPGRDPKLPRGQYVRFMYWLDCRDALRHFHEHYSNKYRLQLSNGLEPRQVEYAAAGATIVTGLARTRTNVDEVSIYVGNLPEDASKPEVEGLFSQFGDVVMVNMVKKSFPGSYNCFAFVEFTTKEEAAYAGAAEIMIRGYQLRIEAKEYTVRRRQRIALGETPIRSPPVAPRPAFATPVNPRPVVSTPPKYRVESGAVSSLQSLMIQNNKDNKALASGQGNQGSGPYIPPHKFGRRGGFGNSSY